MNILNINTIKMETVKERLLQFLKAEHITKAEFTRRMGVSDAYIHTMRKSLSASRVMKLTELFPQLNRDWLLFGEGEMYRKEAASELSEAPEKRYIPLLPVEAYAGSLHAYSEGVKLEECTRLPFEYDGADFAIPVRGDSMEPRIHDGTIAVVARINEMAFIPWGNPMVVDTENGAFIKVLRPLKKEDDLIEASSYNPEYPPFNIPKESIFGLYRILFIYQPMVMV